MVSPYALPAAYRSRTEYCHHDDLPLRDEWQLEVYLHALGLLKKHGLRGPVVDVGCGSGYKLATYLGEYPTVGLELPENVPELRLRYPWKRWEVCDLSGPPPVAEASVVVCADVIEHLVDPDELLAYLGRIRWRYLVLSSPARELLRGDPLGPPVNPAHVREWTTRELRAYVGGAFPVVDHRVVNLAQATQMLVCEGRTA